MLGTLAALLYACAIPPPLLERIKEKGELVVATRYGLTTYYEERGGYAGIEHDLVKAFADKLGVKVRFVVPDRLDRIISLVVRGEVHIAAAGLTVTDRRREAIRFSEPYQQVASQLVYRAGMRRPRNPGELGDAIVEVVSRSSHEERLQALQEEYPDLRWNAQAEITEEELLHLVHEELIDYAVADSTQLILSQRFYPELRVAFDLHAPQPVAWAFPHTQDTSLFDAANAFLAEARENGLLEDLIERYYGHTERLNYVDRRNFQRHLLTRLPLYREMFEQAAAETGVDWRLLAAVGYQESHWNPRAVSPTGVRGIMMLTQDTADQLGIEDRVDPWQSIIGGARYLLWLQEKVPERIGHPDRLWLALAGYNVGFGHLEDARVLTERHGGNPDRWRDVKKNLPLLSRQKYYSTVKYGRARGREPVIYVDNIRAYYDMLNWHIKAEEPDERELNEYPLSIFPAPL